uniref:(northern house mosquito) hypothetical protein n=1 Tax=Culex pipiens TaxID=7175 RepID=A0A8D8FWQ3_CULPI
MVLILAEMSCLSPVTRRRLFVYQSQCSMILGTSVMSLIMTSRRICEWSSLLATCRITTGSLTFWGRPTDRQPQCIWRRRLDAQELRAIFGGFKHHGNIGR